MVVFSLLSQNWTSTTFPAALPFWLVTALLAQESLFRQLALKLATTGPPPLSFPPPPPPPQFTSARRKKPARIAARRPRAVFKYPAPPLEENMAVPHREQGQVRAVHDAVAVHVGIDIIIEIPRGAAEGVLPIEQIAPSHTPRLVDVGAALVEGHLEDAACRPARPPRVGHRQEPRECRRAVHPRRLGNGDIRRHVVTAAGGETVDHNVGPEIRPCLGVEVAAGDGHVQGVSRLLA